jgi:hypothetical protein
MSVTGFRSYLMLMTDSSRQLARLLNRAASPPVSSNNVSRKGKRP